MKALFLTLALLGAHTHARADDLAAPSSGAAEDLPLSPQQPEPALEAPLVPQLDNAPIPAVAVSIATIAHR